MKVKNSIKKVGAVAGSALMVGLTMGSAASLADFPQPFVNDDGTVASQIVVGSNGKVADVVGAVNIAAAAGQSAVQTEERTAGGTTSAGWNANNGATLSTEKTNLFFQDTFSDSGLKTTMTEDDLDLLSSGTVNNVDNQDYSYDQYIEVGDHTTSIGSHNDLDDDQLMVDFASGSPGKLYTSIATFEQGMNVGDAADDNAEIELFGKQFSISSDSNLSADNQLVLFGGQETATVSEDSSTTVTIDGNEIDLYVDSIPESGKANVEIDGSLKNDVQADDTFSVSGIDEEVRIDKIVYRGQLDYGQRGRVVFSIGSEKLTLEDGSPVQVGSDEDDIDGTNVVINGGSPSSDDLSKLEVEVTPQDGDDEYLLVGEQFEDPVFETFSFAFGGMSPGLEADSRSEIEAGVRSDDVGTLTFTDDNGNEATVNIAHHDGSSSIVSYTASNGDYDWSHVEGESMDEDTYFTINRGGFTHLLNVRDIEGNGNGDEIVFRDVFSGTDYTATLDGSAQDEIYIDGQKYHVNADSSTTVQVTWGDGASAGGVGDETTVYATMEDENDAQVAVTDDDAFTHDEAALSTDGGTVHSATLNLPTGTVEVWGDDSATSEGDNNVDQFIVGVDGSNTTVGSAQEIEVGQVGYWFDPTTLDADPATLSVSLSDQTSSPSELQKPAALVVEEEDDDGNQNAFVLSHQDDGNSEIEVASLTYTDSSKKDDGTLDNDDTIHLTDYGTYAVEDDDSEFVELHYPDNQGTMGAGFVADGGSLSTSGGGESVTYEAVTGMGSLPNMARLDSEVTETTKSENHLILVGGPAVNTLVSDLVDSGDVDLSQLEGQSSGALLQTVDDAFASGQHALVVAGVAGSDTRAAARYIANYDTHSSALDDAGSSMILTEADYPSES